MQKALRFGSRASPATDPPTNALRPSVVSLSPLHSYGHHIGFAPEGRWDYARHALRSPHARAPLPRLLRSCQAQSCDAADRRRRLRCCGGCRASGRPHGRASSPGRTRAGARPGVAAAAAKSRPVEGQRNEVVARAKTRHAGSDRLHHIRSDRRLIACYQRTTRTGCHQRRDRQPASRRGSIERAANSRERGDGRSWAGTAALAPARRPAAVWAAGRTGSRCRSCSPQVARSKRSARVSSTKSSTGGRTKSRPTNNHVRAHTVSC